MIEADPTDTKPPATPRAELADVKRGRQVDDSGCGGGGGTSCDDLGYVLLKVSAGAGESDDVGFVVEARGNAPGLLAIVHPRIHQPLDGALTLVWIDGEGKADFDFDLYVWAVDRAGNVSEQPVRVHVDSEGNRDGCATRSTHSRGSWLVLLMLFLVVRSALRVRASNSACRSAAR